MDSGVEAEAAAEGGAPAWFQAPGAEFRPSVFWFWHAIPSEGAMRGQLADMADKGIGTVMVQARLALPIANYLSPAYLEALRFACAEARRVGLKVMLYDEYNWMSGHGGGRTVEGADHLREQHLFWARGAMAGDGLRLTISGIASPFLAFLGEVGRNWVYEGGVARWGDWRIVAAVTELDGGTIADVTLDAFLTATSQDGCSIFVAPETGACEGIAVTVFVAARCLSSRLVNYLLPETAERFASRVYAPLLEAAGGAAEAFFFDHPYAGFYDWAEREGDLGNSLLWDDAFAASALQSPLPSDRRALSQPPSALPGISPSRGEIGQSQPLLWSSTPDAPDKGDDVPISPLEGEMAGRSEGGCDASRRRDKTTLTGQPQTHLALTLLALTRDVGPQTARLRASFFEAYQRQMHEAFFGTLSRWTAARGVGFTGHELLTHVGAWGLQDGLAGFDPRTMPGADPFGVDAFRTATTVDAADFAPQLSAKLGDSVARANGRRRCTVEQYATGREVDRPGLSGQWGLTLERFRAQAIRHVLFGARQMLLHSYNASDGFDDDPRLLLNPRFDFPPGYNFQPWWEDCRAVFDEIARLAAFLEEGEPLGTVALLHPLETIRAEATSPDCGRHFGWWAQALSRAGIGYDILDEPRLSPRLTPPDGAAATRIGTLILPATTTLESRRSAETIARFAQAGGRVLVSGSLPQGTRETGLEADMAAIFASLREGGALTHLPGAGKLEVTAAVAGIDRPKPDVSLEDGPSWSAVTQCGSAWRIAAFNDQSEARRLTIDVGAAPIEVMRWDNAAGAVSAPDMRDDGLLSIDLPPHEVVCLSIRACSDAPPPALSTTPPAAEPSPMPALPSPISLDEGWFFTIRGSGEPPSPIDVSRGWEVQGHATFSGTGVYVSQTELPPLEDGFAWYLVLPKVYETVECRVDGLSLGKRICGDRTFALPGSGRTAAIELHVRNTAANRYYTGTPYASDTPEPSGLAAPPRLEARRAEFADIA